jgi:hypothetical protein
MGFPSIVNAVGALAVLGDFCDGNYRSAVDASYGAFVAGPNGLAVGTFGWADPTNTFISNTGAGAPTGFVRRNQQALITAFLGDDTLVIPGGYQVEIFNTGGFWVKNAGATVAAIGQSAYANNATGAVTFAAAGSPPTGGTVTAALVANATAAISGSIVSNATAITAGLISGTTLTVTTLAAGAVLGAGVVLGGGNSTVGYVVPNTTIVSQLTGTAGGTGTYTVNISQNVATSSTITATGGGFTVTTAGTGAFTVGQTLTGTGVTAGTTIIANGTGTGQNSGGTYVVSIGQTVTSQTISANGGLLNVTAALTGAVAINDTITGGTIAAGTYIVSLFSGTLGGSTASYFVNTSTASGSGTVTALGATQTKWIAASIANPGELVKMVTQLNG